MKLTSPLTQKSLIYFGIRLRTIFQIKIDISSHLHVGSHEDHYLPIKVTTETAWHGLFARLIFVVPQEYNPSKKEEWEILSASNYECIPEEDGTNSEGCVIINFEKEKFCLLE